MGHDSRREEREMKAILEILDTAKVTDHGEITITGFTALQLERALVTIKRIVTMAISQRFQR